MELCVANLDLQKEIGQRKAAEMALRLSEQKLQALSSGLMQAQETASKHLAREIHDDFGQKLAGLGMEATALAYRADASSPELKSALLSLTAQIGSLAKQIHQISSELHPSIVEDLGLAAAIEDVSAFFTELHGIPVKFYGGNIPAVIPSALSLCLYRVAQECLRNTGKHARATEVRVGLFGRNDEIAMEITDNGAGFDIETARGNNGKRGLGLISMEERVRLVEGRFAIRSEPGKGTAVNVCLPLAAISQDAVAPG